MKGQYVNVCLELFKTKKKYSHKRYIVLHSSSVRHDTHYKVLSHFHVNKMTKYITIEIYKYHMGKTGLAPSVVPKSPCFSPPCTPTFEQKPNKARYLTI